MTAPRPSGGGPRQVRPARFGCSGEARRARIMSVPMREAQLYGEDVCMRHVASDTMRYQGGQLPSMKAGDRVTWNYRGKFYYTQPVEATVICVGERTIL